MASVAFGSCSQCRKTLVYMAWREGRRKIIVGCDDCQTEMIFDLEEMLKCSDPIDRAAEILENFVPKGKPS